MDVMIWYIRALWLEVSALTRHWFSRTNFRLNEMNADYLYARVQEGFMYPFPVERYDWMSHTLEFLDFLFHVLTDREIHEERLMYAADLSREALYERAQNAG